MSKQFTIEQVSIILSDMNRLKIEHPKANILFDLERNQILITYPLPKDFLKYQLSTEGENR